MKIAEKLKQNGNKKWIIGLVILILIAIIAFLIWRFVFAGKENDIASGNGRIEATEINIAPRMAAQIREIYVYEGDYVQKGEVLVCMDTDVLNAQLREAKGKLSQAQSLVLINKSKLIERESEKHAEEAVLKQREAELETAEKRWDRSKNLVNEGVVSKQTADDDYATYKSALSAKDAALAKVRAAESAVVTAQEEIKGAEWMVESSIGTVERIEADIRDSALKSPRDARVQYKVAQPGEVMSAGETVLNLVDLTDVYMTFFLPTAFAGRISIGEEARIVLDAQEDCPIPAYISYISDVAQFTPKTVETAAEREKLMFRIKAQIPEEYLKKHMKKIKTGLPGVAYIRLNTEKPWPARLEIKNEC